MPPLPVIANTFRVALLWNGGDPVNVMHFRKAGGTAAGLASILDSNASANMWGPMSSNFAVTQLAITPLNGTSPTTLHAPATPANWQGGVGGDWVPAAAFGMSFSTAKRGRSYRGRNYFGPIAESGMNDGLVGSSYRTAAAAAWGLFMDGLGGDSWAMVIASYRHATAEDVTGATAREFVRTQRRRQRRLVG